MSTQVDDVGGAADGGLIGEHLMADLLAQGLTLRGHRRHDAAPRAHHADGAMQEDKPSWPQQGPRSGRHTHRFSMRGFTGAPAGAAFTILATI